MTSEEILNLPMDHNDAKAETIRDFLKALLAKLWREDESFSGKRPFGNSGWKYAVYNALVLGKAVPGRIVEGDGYRDIECDDEGKADKLIAEAIMALK